MMSEGDLGDAMLGGMAVQKSPAQARAQSAGRLALGDDPPDDAVGILFDDVKGNAPLGQIVRQHRLGKSWLLLVEVDRHDIEMDGRIQPQTEQDIQQRIGILAAR